MAATQHVQYYQYENRLSSLLCATDKRGEREAGRPRSVEPWSHTKPRLPSELESTLTGLGRRGLWPSLQTRATSKHHPSSLPPTFSALFRLTFSDFQAISATSSFLGLRKTPLSTISMSFTLSLARLALRNARSRAMYVGPRGAATVLHLKTGQSFAGRSLGAPKSVFGETVFSTSITSCKHPFFCCVIGDARRRLAPEGLYGYAHPPPFGIPS